MSKIMDELIYNEKETIALRLIKIGKLSREEIVEIVDFPIELIKALEV